MGEQITVNSGSKVIRVNENGDTISIPLGDERFLPAVLDLVDDFKEKESEYKERATAIDAMPISTEAEKLAHFRAAIDFRTSMCSELKSRVDEIFHDSVCDKVFGPGVIPSLELFASFFDQLGPIIRIGMDEQNKKIQKYTAKYHEKG
jgi:hypothetical protein